MQSANTKSIRKPSPAPKKLFGHQGVVNIASLIGDYAATAILLNVADQHVRDVSLLPLP